MVLDVKPSICLNKALEVASEGYSSRLHVGSHRGDA